MDFLTSDEIQTEFYQEFGPISINTNVPPTSAEPLDRAWVEIFQSAVGLYPNGDQALSLANTTEYWRIHNAVATGEIEATAAGAEFQEYLDAND